MKRSELFNPERLRERAEAQYNKELVRQEQAATNSRARGQAHRGHAYVLFGVAAIFAISLYIARWIFEVTSLKLTLLVIGIVAVGIVKLIISFVPRRSPFG